ALVVLVACGGRSDPKPAVTSGSAAPPPHDAGIEERCGNGDSDTCLKLAKDIAAGDHGDRDPAHADEIFAKLCNRKIAEACVELASDDKPRAAELLRRACDLDDALACELLGRE